MSSSPVFLRLAAPCPRHAQELALWADAGHPGTLPESLATHLEQCSACQSFVESLDWQRDLLQRWAQAETRCFDPTGFHDEIQNRRRQQAGADIVAFCRQLLLLDAAFEDAFPLATDGGETPGLLSAWQRLQTSALDAYSKRLPRYLKLLSPIDAQGLPRQSVIGPLERHRLVDGLLREVQKIDPATPEPYLLQAQKTWVFGEVSRVPDLLEESLRRCNRPRQTGTVLLHFAIWRADQGAVQEAVSLLARAVRLAPHHLAVHFTLGVYSAALRQQHRSQQSLRHAAHLGTASDRVRRMLKVRLQMQALSHLGVLPASEVASKTREVLRSVAPSSCSSPSLSHQSLDLPCAPCNRS
jgi:hypothetical protein